MSERRRFADNERTALYWVEGGRCARCGAELEPGWHADHVVPWSAGGETDVVNGQALCPACNLDKGASMPAEPRAWQQRFIAKYHACPGPDFLLVACPGAGKTLATLFVARDLLRDRVVDRILVVVPSSPLRMQWHRAATRLGLLLDGDTMNNQFGERATIGGRRTHGWVVTYTSLALDAMGHKMLNGRRRTLVILDEVHHLSTDNRWGIGAVHALEPCVRRLSTSGTPFRSDRGEIPFIEYKDGWSRYRDDDDGTPYPRGFDYSYGSALAEHNPPERISPVRPVVFEMFDGDVTWLEGDEGQERQARISADLDKQTRRKAKKHALNPAGIWLRDTLSSADRRLLMVRAEGDQLAKGIVFCVDTEHAHEVAGVLASIVGHDQVLVAVSRDAAGDDSTEAALRVIEQFGAGNARWLVSVLMVSEGVDIPELRVDVYATVIRAELYFRQSLGRVQRRVDYLADDVDQTAYVFVPKDPEMVQLADNVLAEVKTALLRDEESGDGEQREDTREWKLNLDSFISATAEAGGILVPGKGTADHQLVNLVAGESGQAVSEVARMVAAVEKLGGSIMLSGHTVAEPTPRRATPEPSYVDRLKARKGQLESGLRQLAAVQQRETGEDFGDIIMPLKVQVYRDAGIPRGGYQRADLPAIDEAIKIVRKLWNER